MKKTILTLTICLLVTYPRSANVRELTSDSAVKSAHSAYKISFEEKLLTVIPKEYKEPKWYEYVSGNHRQWDVVPQVGFGRNYGGWEITLSPDYSKVAYRAKVGKKMFAVINGEKKPDFDDVKYLGFNPDGSKLAYAARLKDKWFIVTGDEKGPEFDNVGPPVFSPDGHRLAYAAYLTKKVFLVVDGKKSEEFKDISSPVFSPDGNTIAFVARPIGSKNAVLFVGDKKVAEHPIISDVTFSPDGKLAYAAGDNKQMAMIVGDQQGPQFDTVLAPTFSPDGTKVAYLAVKPGWNKNKLFVVSGDYRGTDHTFVSPPVFSPSGNKLVYIAGKANYLQGNSLIYLGDKVEESKCVAWDNSEVLSLTGVESWKTTFTVSPDGNKIACKVLPDADRKFLPRYNNWQIAVGNQLSPNFDDVGLPVFASDGSAVGYWAMKDSEIWWKVMTVK
ncbi:MAG TPA: hypothetical protein VJT15_12310 [Pyrinomonadaceae bacterium]|nr:hypothetical protein [Pyrinomonadaceae bacterium]